eukprot:TRINITY_DN9873_c0_g1_i2.p1 TRINITY_DN9873_c0_g1~~TRINITY_DN9873_c0_g1_i2.p1  ORF type:complete len:1715 (+),score=406.26 TRINITY_DN9873_c0_g1_i2:315-5147(+)
MPRDDFFPRTSGPSMSAQELPGALLNVPDMQLAGHPHNAQPVPPLPLKSVRITADPTSSVPAPQSIFSFPDIDSAPASPRSSKAASPRGGVALSAVAAARERRSSRVSLMSDDTDRASTGDGRAVLAFIGKETSWVELADSGGVDLADCLETGVVFDLWIKKRTVSDETDPSVLSIRSTAGDRCEVSITLRRDPKAGVLQIKLHVCDRAGRSYTGYAPGSFFEDEQWHRLQWLLAFGRGEVLLYVDEVKSVIMEGASNHIPTDFEGWAQSWTLGRGLTGELSTLTVWQPLTAETHDRPSLDSVLAQFQLNGKDGYAHAGDVKPKTAHDFPQTSMNFNGANAYVNVGQVGALGSSLGSVTVKFWCRTSETSKEMAVIGVTDNNDQGFGVDLNTHGEGSAPGWIHCWVQDTVGAVCSIAAEAPLTDGQWHLVEWSVLKFETSNVSLTIDGHKPDQCVKVEGGVLYDKQGCEIAFDGCAVFEGLTRYVSLGAHNFRGQITRHFDGSLRDVVVKNSIDEDVLAHWAIDDGPGSNVLSDLSDHEHSALVFRGLTRGADWSRDDKFFSMRLAHEQLEAADGRVRRTKSMMLSVPAQGKVAMACVLYCTDEYERYAYDVLNQEELRGRDAETFPLHVYVECVDLRQFHNFVQAGLEKVASVRRNLTKGGEVGVIGVMVHIRVGTSGIVAVDLAAEQTTSESIAGTVGRRSISRLQDSLQRERQGLPEQSVASPKSLESKRRSRVSSMGSRAGLEGADLVRYLVNKSARHYQTAVAEIGMLPQAVKRCLRLNKTGDAEHALYSTFAQPKSGLFGHTYDSLLSPSKRSSLYAVSVLSKYPSALETISCGALGNALKLKTRYWAARVVQKTLQRYIVGKRVGIKTEARLARMKLREMERRRHPEASAAKQKHTAVLVTVDRPAGAVPTCRTSCDVDAMKSVLEHLGFDVIVFQNSPKEEILALLRRLDYQNHLVFVYVTCYVAETPVWYTPPSLDDFCLWEASARSSVAQEAEREWQTALTDWHDAMAPLLKAEKSDKRFRKKASGGSELRSVLSAARLSGPGPLRTSPTSPPASGAANVISPRVLPKLGRREIPPSVSPSRQRRVTLVEQRNLEDGRHVKLSKEDSGGSSPTARRPRLSRAASLGATDAKPRHRFALGGTDDSTPRAKKGVTPRRDGSLPQLPDAVRKGSLGQSPTKAQTPKARRLTKVAFPTSTSPGPLSPIESETDPDTDTTRTYVYASGTCPTEYSVADLIAYEDLHALVCGEAPELGRHGILCMDCAATKAGVGFGLLAASSEQAVRVEYPEPHQAGLLTHHLLEALWGKAHENGVFTFDTVLYHLLEQLRGHGCIYRAEEGTYVGEMVLSTVPPPKGRIYKVRPEAVLHLRFEGSGPVGQESIRRVVDHIFTVTEGQLDADAGGDAVTASPTNDDVLAPLSVGGDSMGRTLTDSSWSQHREPEARLPSFQNVKLRYTPHITLVFGHHTCHDGWIAVEKRATTQRERDPAWEEFVSEIVDIDGVGCEWRFAPNLEATGGFVLQLTLCTSEQSTIFGVIAKLRSAIALGLECCHYRVTDIQYHTRVSFEAPRDAVVALEVLRRRGALPSNPLAHVKVCVRAMALDV